jgi:hypothetical protein
MRVRMGEGARACVCGPVCVNLRVPVSAGVCKHAPPHACVRAGMRACAPACLSVCPRPSAPISSIECEHMSKTTSTNTPMPCRALLYLKELRHGSVFFASPVSHPSELRFPSEKVALRKEMCWNMQRTPFDKTIQATTCQSATPMFKLRWQPQGITSEHLPKCEPWFHGKVIKHERPAVSQ